MSGKKEPVTPFLMCRGLKKTFARRDGAPVEVLRGLSFDLGAGERVAILGKSGTGKSTFLHLLGTLEAPSAGTVHFEGRNVFAYGDRELSGFRNRELGFVFQFHYLMLEFTALENVMMPALIAGRPRREARDRAKGLLERVGLKARLTHRPGQLSGGEQQRVAIARALVMRPRLLLTDEMTGNLDPSTGRQIFELLGEIHAETGISMVSVTHDESLAASYPKIYRLTDGALVSEK